MHRTGVAFIQVLWCSFAHLQLMIEAELNKCTTLVFMPRCRSAKLQMVQP